MLYNTNAICHRHYNVYLSISWTTTCIKEGITWGISMYYCCYYNYKEALLNIRNMLIQRLVLSYSIKEPMNYLHVSIDFFHVKSSWEDVGKKKSQRVGEALKTLCLSNSYDLRRMHHHLWNFNNSRVQNFIKAPIIIFSPCNGCMLL